MGRGWKALDAILDDFTFREQITHERGLEPPHRAVERRSGLLAGFEIPAREAAPAAVLVRLARAEIPVRW